MVELISPGVNIREIDLTTYISSNSTTVGYIVLRNTYKGDEMSPTLITNEDSLIRMFGLPRNNVFQIDGTESNVSDCYQDILSAIGYLKHGSKLYCSRTMPVSATFAGTKLDSTDTYEGFDENDALTLATETFTQGDINDPDDFANEGDTWIGTDQMWVIAKSRGYWGNSVRISLIDYTTQTEILSGGKTDWQDGEVYNVVNSIDSRLKNDQELMLIVQEKPQQSSSYETVEYFNVSLDEDAKDDQGITKYIETKINTESQYIRLVLNSTAKNNSVPSEWAQENFIDLSGGGDNMGDSLSDASIIESYELVEDPEVYNINMFIDSNKSETVKRSIQTIVEGRKDCVMIADILRSHVINNKGNETTDITQWRKGITSPSFNISSSYVALYGNWLEVYDKYNDKYRWIPASGYMAGIYAYNDIQTDAWFAPAGLNRGTLSGVRRLAWTPTKGQRDILYLAGINPIVSFAGKGKVVWGQKTMLDESSAFNRVNVRRLFVTIEKVISESTKSFVFQPNDKATRRRLTAMISPYLADVKSRRGIYDFLVVCDQRNNTPERIDRNELWVDIYIKPTRAAEFIVLSFIATKTGASFQEII